MSLSFGLEQHYKFELGRMVITPAALEAVSMYDYIPAMELHRCGMWGDLCKEDKAQNDLAVEAGMRILSAFHTDDNVKFWIITEWDRSVTTVLLPDDY